MLRKLYDEKTQCDTCLGFEEPIEDLHDGVMQLTLRDEHGTVEFDFRFCDFHWKMAVDTMPTEMIDLLIDELNQQFVEA